jgi:hypothetical protein
VTYYYSRRIANSPFWEVVEVDNPNEYDDDAFVAAGAAGQMQEGLGNAVQALWDAGASPEDIATEIQSTLENIDDVGPAVLEYLTRMPA